MNPTPDIVADQIKHTLAMNNLASIGANLDKLIACRKRLEAENEELKRLVADLRNQLHQRNN